MSDKERDTRRERVDGKEAAQGIGNNSKFRSTVRSLMYGLDSFISAKTVLGDPITIGDTIILPLVDVSFGVGAGSFGANTQNTDGNSGGGLHGKMSPTAVLVVKDGIARVVSVKDQDMITKVIDMAPDVVDKVTSFVKSKDTKSGTKKDKDIDDDIKDMFKNKED